jgi:hypothetical protein
MLVDAMVSTLRTMFDTDTATAKGWVQERFDEMIDESGWSKNPVLSLSSTIAGTAIYTISTTVARLSTIIVGGQEYQPVGEQTLEDLRTSNLFLTHLPTGTGGVFAPSGTNAIELYPAPTTSGVAITGRVSLEAIDIVDGTEPAIPRGLHTYLLEGAIALGFERSDERVDLAGPHEQKFQIGIDKLRRRTLSRLGHGVHRIRVI